ncbi:4-carboxymuconolactone decarboxylase [Phytohabitans suffuscus]|uniref:Uncharacterized protein n=1 Tax=Phytohabitans suffuscus TaxID=624315 RepID=A0A6F8YTJ1_9ACTN|nr:4-carboxymuconolactone decarboxylase [Phytohabitans suffuscus]BCB89432.1 hypothetical protein Psuf_067450 [Phytohabitans suffuscus]
MGDDGSRLARGARIRREVLGDAHVKGAVREESTVDGAPVGTAAG